MPTQDPTPPGTTLTDLTVPPREPWSGVVRRGQHLRIVDLEVLQAVDFLCYNARDPAALLRPPLVHAPDGRLVRVQGPHGLVGAGFEPLRNPQRDFSLANRKTPRPRPLYAAFRPVSLISEIAPAIGRR